MKLDEAIELLCGKKPIEIKGNAANIWSQWYAGKVEEFHKYRVYNGNTFIEQVKKSLNMAKTVCEDWSDLLVNEKTNISIPDDDKIKLESIFQENNFRCLLNEAVERSYALGNGFILLGLKDYNVGTDTGIITPNENTTISIDFVDAFGFKILKMENRKVEEIAFYNETDKDYKISVHYKDDNGNYIIRYAKVKKNDRFLNKEDIRTIYTESPIKWFYHVKPNVNNNSFTYDNSLGISIFANALDVLASIDNKYDAFDIEFINGRIRTFVSAQATKMVRNGSGEMVKSFDPYDNVFYQLPESPDGKQSVQTEAPALRYDAFIASINTDLNLLCKKVGFGTERYKFDKGGIATATQIISENSDMARSVVKHEHLFRNIMIDMVWAIKYINNKFTKQEKFTEFKKTDIGIDFDDSVIEDKNAIRERDRADVEKGLMSMVEYRMKHYAETKEDAEKFFRENYLYKLIEDNFTALQDGVMSPKEFVLRVWGVEDNERISYIEEHLKTESDPMSLFDEINKDTDTGDEE